MPKLQYYFWVFCWLFSYNLAGAQCTFSVSSSSSNAAYTQIYVLVDAANNIVAQNQTGTFAAVPTGNYHIHALNFNPADAPAPLPAALIGQQVSLVGSTTAGCFNSDFLTDYISRNCGGCAASRTACSADPIVVTSSASAVGYTQLYVLVDASSSEIVATSASGDFTGQVAAGTGYQVHALNYDPANAPNPLPTAGAMLGSVGSNSAGCFNSDFLTDYVCLNITDCVNNCFKSSNVCPGTNITAKASGSNAAYTQTYVLTDANGLFIAQNNTGIFSTAGQPLGTNLRVHALNYDPSNPPNSFTVGAPINTIAGGCFNSDFLTDFVCYTVACTTLVLDNEAVQLFGHTETTSNRLTWRAIQENNLSSYQLERSPNGYNDFKTIGDPETPSQQLQYNRIDNEPIYEAYYRLRLLRPNGQTDFSNLVFLQRSHASQSIRIYPNPTAQNLFVEFDANTAENATISVTDLLGRKIQTIDFQTNIGANRQILDLSELPAAVYTLSLQGSSFAAIKKIIKN